MGYAVPRGGALTQWLALFGTKSVQFTTESSDNTGNCGEDMNMCVMHAWEDTYNTKTG